MVNNIIRGFQNKHYYAKAQWQKDLWLIGTVISCIVIRLVQAVVSFILFPFIMLGIGIWECTKQLWVGFIAWFISPWEFLKHIPTYIKALKLIGKPILPVNKMRKD